jgi:hypothetical protein
MEIGVTQSLFGDAVEGGSRNHAAKRTWRTEADIVGHDQQDIGRAFRGTTRGAHQGFDSDAFSLISPPKTAGGGGICLPSMVVVAPGAPNSPVTTCALVGPESVVILRRNTTRLLVCKTSQ